jgi:hypothetical protein
MKWDQNVTTPHTPHGTNEKLCFSLLLVPQRWGAKKESRIQKKKYSSVRQAYNEANNKTRKAFYANNNFFRGC